MTGDLARIDPRHGPHAPTSGTPARAPGSMRRTSTVDMLRPAGPDGPLRLVGRGRDLRSGPDGAPEVLGEATCDGLVDFVDGRFLRTFSTIPHRPALAGLVGHRVAAGFRTTALELDPELPAEAGLLHLLVDDLPVATLVSGHAFSAAAVELPISPSGQSSLAMRGRPMFGRDMCAGFANGGTIMAGVDRTGRSPLVTGPDAPALSTTDPSAWHELGPLPAGSMRRARRVDVRRVGDIAEADVLFRDSYVRTDGVETVIHEYTVTMRADLTRGPSGTVLDCVATPRVLPWLECPAAAASAARLAGLPFAGLRHTVRQTFLGTSTCTHLNDTLRSLEDVPYLADRTS